MNIGDAKTRLSELVAACLRGEEVVLQKAGEPVVKLVPIGDLEVARKAQVARMRIANIGKYRDMYAGVELTVPSSMSEEEAEARARRFSDPSA